MVGEALERWKHSNDDAVLALHTAPSTTNIAPTTNTARPPIRRARTLSTNTPRPPVRRARTLSTNTPRPPVRRARTLSTNTPRPSVPRRQNAPVDKSSAEYINRQWVCSTCGDRFEYESYLSDHLDVHSDITLTCEICGRNIKRLKDLKRHKKLQHGVGSASSSASATSFTSIPEEEYEDPRIPSLSRDLTWPAAGEGPHEQLSSFVDSEDMECDENFWDAPPLPRFAEQYKPIAASVDRLIVGSPEGPGPVQAMNEQDTGTHELSDMERTIRPGDPFSLSDHCSRVLDGVSSVNGEQLRGNTNSVTSRSDDGYFIVNRYDLDRIGAMDDVQHAAQSPQDDSLINQGVIHDPAWKHSEPIIPNVTQNAMHLARISREVYDYGAGYAGNAQHAENPPYVAPELHGFVPVNQGLAQHASQVAQEHHDYGQLNPNFARNSLPSSSNVARNFLPFAHGSQGLFDVGAGNAGDAQNSAQSQSEMQRILDADVDSDFGHALFVDSPAAITLDEPGWDFLDNLSPGGQGEHAPIFSS